MKIVLLGIAIILFAISFKQVSNGLEMFVLGTSVVGLLISFVGCFIETRDDWIWTIALVNSLYINYMN